MHDDELTGPAGADDRPGEVPPLLESVLSNYAPNNVAPVGSLQWKPFGGKVVVMLLGDDMLEFAEIYTPDQADQLADYIKVTAARARAGESRSLNPDEVDMLREEGWFAELGLPRDDSDEE